MSKKRLLTIIILLLAVTALSWGIEQSTAYVPPPSLVPGVPAATYLLPNYNLSPIVRKFVDSLPMVLPPTTPGPGVGNNLGNYLPQAVPMAASNFSACANPAVQPCVPLDADYYEIAVVDYTQQMHSDLPPTLLRGYVQIEPQGATQPVAGSLHVALTNPDGTAVTFSDGITQVYGYDKPRYMGPVIVATRGKPVRMKFYNLLRTSAKGGDLFLPVDTTIMGAGMGPPSKLQVNGAMYSSNRAVLHLHGGDTAWISDGTPNQWITPANETADPAYQQGPSHQNVPDMPLPPGGAATIYYTNAETGRLMFYHDHAYGTTRQDVYAGEAAGYLLTDPTEEGLTTTFVTSLTPAGQDIPLIIQDRSFVNINNTLPTGYVDSFTPYNVTYNTLALDPTWATASPLYPATAAALIAGKPEWGQTNGSLWFPHLYMPNQNPNDPSGANPMGRWDYGAWFWPIFPVVGNVPEISAVPEAFVDTPIVNGQAYPYLNVQPTTYRFRILNACNDRYLNLQLYVATSIVNNITVAAAGSGYTFAPAVTITDPTGIGATAEATMAPDPVPATTFHVAGISLTSVGSGYTAPVVTLSAPPAGGTQATATATTFTSLASVNPSEVGMLPADNGFTATTFAGWPNEWTANDTTGLTPDILDSRPGGVPDPGNTGPTFVHIGMEGGIANHAVPLVNTPVGYEQNKRSVTVLNVLEHTEYLGPAERADVMVDFSKFAGKTIILYNDAPAPLPGEDPRNNYYTADPDNTFQGGAPHTQAGFGPNTRTIMQFRVANVAPAAALNPASLDTAVNAAFTGANYQPPLIVSPNVYARISDTSLVPNGAPAPVGSVTLTTGGTGYQSVPTVQFVGGGYTTLATATATVANGVVTGVTLTTNGLPSATSGAGYTSIPAVQFVGGNPTTPAEAVADLAGSLPLQPKTIQELFDPLGRMNATLGVEIPRTSATTQTTIPYGYVDPETEIIPDGGTQLWKITHNGVDTHAIHFHLFNVQVVNRIGWDGMIKPPWPEEIGWKETVKMNPLEDVVVALRAKVPTVPFAAQIPNSMRPLSPAMPLGSTVGFFGVDPSGNPVTVVNQMANFGSEYVWHCHLLGHEENDMMRPLSMAVPPLAPTNLAYTVSKGNAVLTWKDVSSDETAFMVQKKVGTGPWITLATLPAGTTTYTDTTFKQNQGAQYQVIAVNTVGSGVAGYPSVTVTSQPSNIAAAPLGATTITSLTQALAVGSPVVVKWTYSATDQTGFTIQRSTRNTFPANGTATFNVAGNVFTYSDTITGLKRNTTYYYRVIPFNANGSGAPSNTASLLVHP